MRRPRRWLSFGLTVLLLTGAAAAQNSPSLDEKWEDLLLLEAFRHLRATDSQMRLMRPLAAAAQRRMTQLEEKQRALINEAERLIERNRAAALDGKPSLPTEEARLLELMTTLARQRDEAAAEVVASLTPRLLQILNREQVRRAYELAIGEKPADLAVSPAIYDLRSGFVLGTSPRVGPSPNSLRNSLRRLYARRAPSPPAGAPGATAAAAVDPSVSLESLAVPVFYTELADVGFERLDARTPASTASAVRSAFVLRAGGQAGQATRAADPIAELPGEELRQALAPFVRRVFLSPRCVAVIDAREDRILAR